jgi:hypothetical protein
MKDIFKNLQMYLGGRAVRIRRCPPATYLKRRMRIMSGRVPSMGGRKGTLQVRRE